MTARIRRVAASSLGGQFPPRCSRMVSANLFTLNTFTLKRGRSPTGALSEDSMCPWDSRGGILLPSRK